MLLRKAHKINKAPRSAAHDPLGAFHRVSLIIGTRNIDGNSDFLDKQINHASVIPGTVHGKPFDTRNTT